MLWSGGSDEGIDGGGEGWKGSRRGTDGGEVPILLANTQCTNKTT